MQKKVAGWLEGKSELIRSKVDKPVCFLLSIILFPNEKEKMFVKVKEMIQIFFLSENARLEKH